VRTFATSNGTHSEYIFNSAIGGLTVIRAHKYCKDIPLKAMCPDSFVVSSPIKGTMGQPSLQKRYIFRILGRHVYHLFQQVFSIAFAHFVSYYEPTLCNDAFKFLSQS
jgi:hypothetical protein